MKRITKKWDKERKRPVVLLDFDDVLFDFLGTVTKRYNEITGENLSVEDFKTWDLSETGDIHVFMNIIKDPNLWKDMPEKDGAMEIVQRLINDGRWNVLICTACTTLEEYVVKVGLIEEKIPGFDTAKILNVADKRKRRYLICSSFWVVFFEISVKSRRAVCKQRAFDCFFLSR